MNDDWSEELLWFYIHPDWFDERIRIIDSRTNAHEYLRWPMCYEGFFISQVMHYQQTYIFWYIEF